MGYVRIGVAVAAWMLMAGVVAVAYENGTKMRAEPETAVPLVMAPTVGLVAAAVVARNRVGARAAVTLAVIVTVFGINFVLCGVVMGEWLRKTGRANPLVPFRALGDDRLVWAEYVLVLVAVVSAFSARRRPPPKTDPES